MLSASPVDAAILVSGPYPLVISATPVLRQERSSRNIGKYQVGSLSFSFCSLPGASRLLLKSTTVRCHCKRKLVSMWFSPFLASALILCTWKRVAHCELIGYLCFFLSLLPPLIGMGCVNRDLCPSSVVSRRWSYQPALVPRWQQSPSHHSFSCLPVSGRKVEVRPSRKPLCFWNLTVDCQREARAGFGVVGPNPFVAHVSESGRPRCGPVRDGQLSQGAVR